MNQLPLTSASPGIMDFRAFEAAPGISVIVLPNDPVYTHVAVSNDFIQASGMKRSEVIGKGHFEVFPNSPTDPYAAGEKNLRASFQQIIATGKPHQLPVQRYDIPNGDGTFSEKYWKINNAPILSDTGEVEYIIHSAVDVTEQIQNEQENKQTLRFFFDSSPIGIIVYESIRDKANKITDFRIKHHNDRYCQLTGLTLVELETLTFCKLSQALKIVSVFDQYCKVVETGKALVREQFIARTNCWLSISVFKFGDGFQATLTDITELKNSQQALKEEILFSKGILNASLNGIYVLEAQWNNQGKVSDFTFLQGNQKFTELTGWAIENLIGKSFLTLFPHTVKNGFFDLLCQVIENGESHRQTMYFAQSFNRWYDYMAVRLGANRVVITFQEITQQRETAIKIEQQKNLLDNILKNSPSGIAVYSAIRDKEGVPIDFQCILANGAAETFTNIPNTIRLTKSTLEINPELKESALLGKAVYTLLTGEPFQTQYYFKPAKKWLELSVVKMDNDHLINVFTDITSTKEAQVELEQSIEELKRSNDELEQFVYVASHDLQEPLRKIRFFNDIISSKIEQDNELRRYIDKVDDSAKRMTGLIKSLLDYSRLTKSSSRFEKVDLNEIVRNVLADYELTINQKSATINNPDLPIIQGIPLQLNQLFFNLIGNALKFARKDVPPVITLTARSLSQEKKAAFTQLQEGKDYLEITVQDNGIGFNQEYAQKIFTIFQRLNDRSLYGGYGIGLALCKKVVDTHNGIIYAEGKPKEGATFTIILPFSQ